MTGIPIEEKIKEAIEKIINRLLSTGSVPKDELTNLVGDESTCNRALTKLKQMKITTKILLDGKEAWQLMNPDRFRGTGLNALLMELYPVEETGSKLIYGAYKDVPFTIEFTTPSLAGTPTDEGKLVFRRINGHIWIMPAYLKAMFRTSIRLLPGLGVRASSALQHYTYFKDIHIVNGDKTEDVTLVAPGGRGIYLAEVLPVGTKIEFVVSFPQSTLKLEQIMTLLFEAGEKVGLSQAKHEQGWGRFKLIQKITEEKVEGSS